MNGLKTEPTTRQIKQKKKMRNGSHCSFMNMCAFCRNLLCVNICVSTVCEQCGAHNFSRALAATVHRSFIAFMPFGSSAEHKISPQHTYTQRESGMDTFIGIDRFVVWNVNVLSQRKYRQICVPAERIDSSTLFATFHQLCVCVVCIYDKYRTSIYGDISFTSGRRLQSRTKLNSTFHVGFQKTIISSLSSSGCVACRHRVR